MYSTVENKFPVLMNTELEDFKPAILVNAINESGLGDASKHLYFVLLSTALKRAIKDHKLKFKLNIKGLFKKPRHSELAKNGIQYLELDDVKALKAAEVPKAKKRKARDLFLLMCLSGMPISDAFEFSPSSHITPDGKWFSYRRTKTKNACLIPVTDDAREIIDRYKDEWPLGDSIGTTRNFWNHCQWMGEIVGKKISAHTARRTAGCLFLTWGFSLESTSHFLGHSDVRQTASAYATVTQGKIEKEMLAMPVGTMSLK